MQKISGVGHVNNRFVAEEVNSGQAPTQITASWMNAVQDEIVNVVVEAGLSLDTNNNAQLLAALKTLSENKYIVASGTTSAYQGVYLPLVANPTKGIFSLNTVAVGTNAIAGVTLALNNGTAYPIIKEDGALKVGNMPKIARLHWYPQLSCWYLLNPVLPRLLLGSNSAGDTFSDYEIIPMGLRVGGTLVDKITQWGGQQDTTGNPIVTLPIAFPNKMLYRIATNDDKGIETPDATTIPLSLACYGAYSKTQIKIASRQGVSSTPVVAGFFTWMTFGY